MNNNAPFKNDIYVHNKAIKSIHEKHLFHLKYYYALKLHVISYKLSEMKRFF